MRLSPKDTRLVAALKTPQTLLAMVRDAARNRLLGAGLDGHLYAADLAVWPPAADMPAVPMDGGPKANGASNANANGNGNSAAARAPAKSDTAKSDTAKSDTGKKDAVEVMRREATKLWHLHDNYVASLALHDNVLISASFDRTLAWWNVATGERLRTVAAHDGWVRKVVILPSIPPASPTGAAPATGAAPPTGAASPSSSPVNAVSTPWRVVSVGDDMVAKVWDGVTGEWIATLRGHAPRSPQGFATALYMVAAHPSGRFVAAADRTGECLVWEVGSGAVAARFTAADFYTYDTAKRARSIGGIRALAFSPDGTKLALAGIGQVTNVDGFVGPARLELWDWQAARRDYAGQAKHQAIQNDVQFVAPATPPMPANPSGSPATAVGDSTAASADPIIPWIVTAGGGDSGGNVAFWKTSDSAPVHLAKPEGHAHQLLFDLDQGRMFLAGHGGFQIWRTY